MFSCEYRNIFKKTYFEEHLRTAATVSVSSVYFAPTLPGAWYIYLLFQVIEGGAWYSECLKWHKIDEGIADHNHAKLKVKDHEKHFKQPTQTQP